MNTLSIRDFRSNMAMVLDRADAGEKVIIRRRDKLYTLAPVTEDNFTITPELATKIEKARKEYREGKSLIFNSAAEAQKWLEEL